MPSSQGLLRACTALLPLALAGALLSVAPLSISHRQKPDSRAARIPTVRADLAELDIRLINNNGGNLLFACKLLTDGHTLTLIGTGPGDAFIFRVRNGKHVGKTRSFAGHPIILPNPELAQSFADIIANFELCVDQTGPVPVSGGCITKIACRTDRSSSPMNSYSIAPNLSHREVRKLTDLCFALGALYQHELLRDIHGKTAILGTLHNDAQELASTLRDRRAAYEELEIAYAEDAICPWGKIAALTRFRPEMGELASQSTLVKQAHEILSAAFSAKGLKHLWGPDTPLPTSCLIRIGDVACRFGAYSYDLTDIDWGFDDIHNSLGFVYPPADSPLRVAMLDIGTERLLLDFVFGKPAAYFGKTLALDRGVWTVLTEYYGSEVALTPVQRKRLDYVTRRSGLLEFLFKGPIQDFAYVDISSLSIRDNQSSVAKIDFNIGFARWVLPVNGSANGWITHKRWSACDYYAPHGCFGRDTFRSADDVNATDREEFNAGK